MDVQIFKGWGDEKTSITFERKKEGAYVLEKVGGGGE